MSTEKEAFLEIHAMHAETLEPELQECVTEGPIGPMIAHPLVHCVMFVPGLANRQLMFKRKKLVKAVEQSDWHSYVFLHERPYRTEALLRLHDELGLDWSDLGDLPAEVWTDTENIHQHIEDWQRIMRETDGRQWMNRDEAETLADLPKQLTIYRGECNDGEVSWTLSPSTAKFFADRATHDGRHTIIMGKVKRDDVFCYLSRRNEFEVIVPDRSKVTTLKQWRTDR